MLTMQWLMGALWIISCLGYMWLVRRLAALPWEFIPVFVFSSIACIVFVGGLAEQLYPVSQALMILGLIAFGTNLFLWLRQGTFYFRISFSLFQIVFLIGSLFFFILLFQLKLTHYDNFSHWAIVLKQMLSTDAFPTADSNLIDFKNYPLGISSFLYYVCRFVGRSQSVMIVAQGLLIFSSFYAMFGIIAEKKRFLLYAFLGLGLSILSIFNIPIRISDLLVDFLLPIYTLAIFAVVYRYRDDLKRACWVGVPLASLLTVMKTTGIIYAAIGIIFLIYIAMMKVNLSVWKKIVALLGTSIGVLLPYFGWSWRMATVFQGIESKFDVASSGLHNTAMRKSPEEMQDIISLFLKSSLDLTTRPTLGIIIFELAAIVASVFAAIVLKKRWQLWKALIALNIVLILYYAGILGMYLFSMPLDEAVRLAGFERYASSIVMLFVGGLVLCATVDMERSFYYKIGEIPSHRAFKNVRTKELYQKGVIVCLSAAIILLLSEYNGIRSIASTYETTLPYKVYTVTGDRWHENGKEDHSRYLFYSSDANLQVTNYYLQYIGRYYLYAPHVDGIVLFYEDNMDHLLSGYDYLVVVESNPVDSHLLKKHYGVEMREGIYKITKNEDGAGVRLTLLET